MSHRLVVAVVLCLLAVFPAVSQAQTVAFIDQDAPATALLDGSTVRVRVADPAANANLGRDSVLVTVTSDLAGDSESLSLLETGPTSGVFEGVIELEPGGSLAAPTLATITTPGPPPARDTIHASYGSATATAGLVGSTIRFIDDEGHESASFAAGYGVGLRVRDELRNVSLSRDALTVTVVSQNAGDSRQVTLQETGVNTGVFEGIFGTVRTPGSSGSGLAVAVPDTLTATLAAADGVTSASRQAQIAGGRVVLRDADGEPAATYLEGEPVRIRVIDPAMPASVTVQVTATLSGDSETFAFPGSYLYDGQIPTFLTDGPATPGDGVLQITGSGAPIQTDTVTVTYSGGGGSASDSAGFIQGRLAFVNGRDEAVSSVVAGSELRIRLDYRNWNTPGVDVLQLALFNESTAEQETLALTETSRDSGVYTASFPLTMSASPSFDGRLSAQPGEQVRIAFQYQTTLLEALATADYVALEFLDEWGEPTDEVVETGPARVRLHSVALNFSPTSVGSGPVEMRVRLTGDLEPLTVTETGPDTGVFEGSIPTEMSTNAQSDGKLQTVNSGVPDYRQDEVMARSGPVEAAARMVGARIDFLDAFGRKATHFAAGDTVRIRIVDHYQTYYLRSSFPLEVASLRVGDSETVTMQRVGQTAVYEGSVATTTPYGGGNPTGKLLVDLTDQIEVRHVTGFSPIEITKRAAVTGSSVLFVDAAGQPAEVYLESTRAYVRVVSGYSNGDPGTAGTITVSLLAELSQDNETLTLTETGPDTGVFEGSIPLRLSFGSVYLGDGTLETTEMGGGQNGPHQFDTLRATFDGVPGEAAVARIGLTGSRTWFGNAAGDEVLSFPAGGTPWVWVEDQNANRPGQWDRVYVQLNSYPSGDQESLELLETTRDSGIFRGSFQMANDSPTSASGRLYAGPGDQIEAVHQDSYGATASSAVADVSGLSLELIDEAGQPVTEILEGGEARVRMFGIFQNTNPGAADTVTIEIKGEQSFDVEQLTLTETGADTSVFEGSIPMAVGGGSSGNGTLETLPGGAPDYQDDQVTARFGGEQATATAVGARVVFLDAYGRVATSFTAGEPVRVRVVDHNRNTPEARETVNVQLVSRDGADSEPLALQETGFDTAVFEGSLPSVFGGGGSGGPGDGQLRVYPEDRAEAWYTAAFRPVPMVATASVTGNSILFIDAAGQPASVYLESSRAYLRVFSSYVNSIPGSPSTVDTIQVEVVSELMPDVETVPLTETGPNTGVFEGSIQMRLSFSGPQQGNGILETAEIGHPVNLPPHEVDRLRATFADAAGTSVARIGLTGSRTWFADASGQEVLSYASGSRAYVRVEDQNSNRPDQWDYVYVELDSLQSGDHEFLQIHETTRDSGIFAGSIELVLDSPLSANGKLYAAPGEQIEATHQDSYGATASSAVADVEGGSLSFVDEAGEPTTELLESGVARVRLFTVYANTSPGQVDTAAVLVRTAFSGDQELVTLTETGVDTSLFEGSIDMGVGAGHQNDGSLNTLNDGFPEYRPDRVTAQAGPVEASAVVVGARMTFIDGYGREASSFAAGEPVRVRVVDHNRNTPEARETVNVQLVSRDGGDSEPLALQETGFDTAVFEGSLPSVFGGTSGPSDGQLRVYPGDQVEAQHSLAFNPNPLIAQASVTGNAVLFIDAAGQPATVYLESSRAIVRVVSPYSNHQPTEAETVSVQIVAELSADQELLTLNETGPNTGVFEGSIQMRLVFGSGQQGNGILETTELGHPVNQPPHEVDRLRATYSDAAGTSVARIGLTGSRTWFADASGQEVLSYASGGHAYIRVEDQNSNRPDQWDYVYVELKSLQSGDHEFLQIHETSRDSGLFAGSIELVLDSPTSANGKLYASPGEQIEATHMDYFGATSSSAIADIEGGSLSFVDEAGEPVTELLEGGEGRVRLFSVYGNTNQNQVDTVSILVRSQHYGDQESVSLTETGPNTSVFEGSFSLATGLANPNNGTLETRNSGFPEYRPDRVTAQYGPVEATAVVSGARMTFIDGYGREASSFAAGEPVRVRVVDHNRNTPEVRETVNVQLVSRDGGDSEPLVLQETGFDTAVFEGSLPSVFGGTSSPSDGQLRVYPGDQVEAQHSLAFNPNPLLAHASVAGNAVLFIDAAGQPAMAYLESSRAIVRVVSPYSNRYPNEAESVSVQIVAELSADQELMTLTETGPNTGVFEGSIQMRLIFGGGQQGNGFLETTELGHPVHQPPHEVDRLRVTYSDAAGTSVARIGLTGSRTWFADASGQEVLSYAAGGRAYIRVEDQNGNRPDQWDYVYVELDSLQSGDHEFLQLHETSRDSGIFAGSIELTLDSPTSANGKLYASPGEQIEATHQDYFGSTSSSAVADIEGGTLSFVDEAGEPVTELLESGEGRVRLFSVYGNSNPSQVDTVSILVRSQRYGDQESVTLTETGPGTSVFEGSFSLATGLPSPNNGTLETRNSGFPEYQPDQVQAQYGPVEATAVVSGARMTFIDGYGREATSFAAGEPVRVRVVDHNRNTPETRETVNVQLVSRDGGDSEPLVLQETGFDTAVFEGTLPSTFGGSGGGSGPSDGQLRVYPGDQVEAQHSLAFDPNPLLAHAAVTGNAVLFIDAAGQPATVYLESSRAIVRVASPYSNRDPNEAESVSVQIVAELSADQELMTLTETGPNTGVFEGSIQMRLVFGGGQQGNGILETAELGHPVNLPPHEVDRLRVTYSDAAGTSVARIGLTGSRTWFADASGQEVLSYASGGRAYIRVEDQNANRTDQWDRVYVELSSLESGDHEFLELWETARDSGLFAGSIELTLDSPTQGNGKLYASPGDQIEATHMDYFGSTSSSAIADIEGGSLSFVDEAGEPTDELLESGEGRVRLFSVYGNANPSQVDTVSILVRSQRYGDQESVTLTETGPGTSVFEGSFSLAVGLPSPNNGTLETRNSGFPEYQPDQVKALYGPVEATAVVSGARVTFIDGFGREATSFAAGEPVRVRVVDHNRNTPETRETVNVQLVSRDGGDSEPLVLQETGFDTAVFEGMLPSVFGGGSGPSDGQLRVYPGDQVEAQHSQAFDPNPLRAHAAVTGNAVLFIDAAGQPATVYLESSRAIVRVVSPYSNRDPNEAESVSVQIVAELSADQELMTLTETGPNTGVFEGSIQMSLVFGSGQQGNGILETTELNIPYNQPPYEIDRLRVTYSDASGTAVARIGLTGSRTWFADASGQEVLSYAAGGRAYVRVEDQNANRRDQWDRTYVELRSLESGDHEFLELWETARDSGIFAGSIELTLDSPATSNGKLYAAPGERIEATHQDYFGSTSTSAVAEIEGGSLSFVDEAGEPVTELLESGEGRVRLFSVYGNANPSQVDTVSILVRSQRYGDQESVTLTETGPGTSVFEGSFSLAAGLPSPNNGTLETRNSGFPEYQPDQVKAQYGPVEATAVVKGARVTFIDGFGREVTSFAAGEPVRVRVVDHNRNTPESRETVNVQLVSRDGGDSEPLVLQETGFDTAVFEGSLPSILGGGGGGGNPSDGQLRVYPGDQVEAQHSQAFDPNPLRAHAAVAGNAVLFIDAAGQPATVYLESSRAIVRVVSSFANTDPGSPEMVTAQVMSELTPDLETVSLAETGPNTGVFEGSIQMRLSFSVQPGNGILETVELGFPVYQPPHVVDTLRATYSDPSGTSVARIGLTGSRTWFADAAGEEVLAYAVGGTAWIRVEDQNFNQPGIQDIVGVTVRSLTTGDQEYLTLSETTVDSGIFAGSILLSATGPLETVDGLFRVQPGEQIEAVHQDYYGATDSSAIADVNAASIEFVDEAGQATGELLEGGTARVRVFSLYANGDPSTAETVTVQVAGRYDAESLTLTETGASTGLFEGSIPMQRGPGGVVDGVLQTHDTGYPAYQPDEVTASVGPVSATATVVPARLAFLNLRGQEVSSYSLGSTVRLRVADHHQNVDSGQIDTLPIAVRSLAAGDSEMLVLTETGLDTGLFEGSLPTTGAPPVSSGDGVLFAPPGTVEAEHMPAFSAQPILRQATILSSQAPMAADDTATTEEDTAVVIPVLANDIGAGNLTVAAVTQPAHGSVTINLDGTVTYTPAAGYSGPDAFTYVAVDPQGGEDEAEVTVTVTPGNQAPTPDYDSATTPEDQPVAVSVLANDTDPDNDSLRVVAVTQPVAGGTAAIDPDEATVTFTPAPNFNGQAVFQYTVRDPGGLEGTSAVTVTVTPVNDPPVANDDAVSTPEDTLVTIDAAANDSDIDSAAYYVENVLPPAHGTAVIQLGRTILYTPDPDFTGTDSFDYILWDEEGAVATATVTVTVTSENDAPVANDDTANVAEDGEVSIAVLGNDTDAENDPLDVTAVTQGAHGSVVLNADDTVTYTPNANFSGTDSFTYTVTDGNGTATASVTVTVTAGNDAPVANDDAATVAEDGEVAVSVLGNDTDPEDDPLQVDSVTQGAHGTVTINPDRTVTYAPAAHYHGTDTFTYTASDGNGGTDTATVTVTVTPVNDAPVANDDTALVDEDGSVSVPVLANDDDADDDTLTVASVTQGAHGTVTINPDQTVTYTPAANYSGADTFTYTVSDGNGGTDTAAVTVTVGSDNDAPAANADSATTAEDTAVTVNVLANDTDPDNDALDVLSVTQGAHGTVVLNANDTVTYTPALNFHGTDTFTYTVSDGNGGSATATVTVTVTPVNDAPAANADAALTTEDGSVNVPVLANDDDADGDDLAVASVTQGAHGTVVINPDQTVTYTPAANYHGSDSFTYTVSDGNGGTATATVTVTISSANDAPAASPDSAATAEDTPVTVTVLANDSDPENDALDVTAVSQGANGSVVINPDETVTYTPNANFTGTDSFTYTVSDGNGGTSTAAVTVTVAPANDGPVAGADAATVAEDGSVSITVLANDSDPENDALDVTAVTQGANGTVTLNADDTVTYAPNANFSGSDAFTYTVVDGNGGTATASVTITVTPVNDSPVAVADAATTAEDSPVIVAVLGNDSDLDNDTLHVTAVTQGAHGTVAVNANDTVTYTPAANYSGGDTFTYTVSDGNGGTATATVTITVTADNDAPTASPDSATVAEDGSVAVTVLANDSDPENDTLNVASVTQGAHGSVTINPNKTVTYAPAANYNGADSFTYTINDGNGGTATATVTVTVTPVNDAPVAAADAATVPEDGSVAVNVLGNDSDADNHTLSVTSVTQGAHGSVAINPNQTVTYTPAANYSGGDSFTYTISDGNGGTATATVTVTVNSINDGPTANPNTASTAEDVPVAINVLANDTDPEGNPLNVASVTQGAHGSVTINPNKTVTYAPAANYNGSDSFTYTINDGNGGTATATVTVTITPVNDAPVAVNDTAATLAEVAVDVAVLGNDTDVDGQALSIQSVTQPAHGTVSINANQTLRYTPAAGFKGADDTFTYVARDGAGGTATATVNVSVNAPPRVATNLQVLYGFNEGSGTTVTDTSGVGTPLNLTIGSAAAVTWISGGLQVNSATLIQSAGAATKVISASQSTNEITLEAWINPLNTSQTAPIATLSQQSNKLNAMLGQAGNRWTSKLRTSNTNQAGVALNAATGSATLNLTHVVYTRDAAGNVRIYVNGVQSASSTLAGDFSSWTANYKLGLVNELASGTPWRGKLYLVAIYNRALTSAEARQNWLAGQ